MKREETPRIITDRILGICREINADVQPVYVNYLPAAGAEKNDWFDKETGAFYSDRCFANVTEQVKKYHGKKIVGWIFLKWANMMLEVLPYCVWENPEGELADITPMDGEKRNILFLEDKNLLPLVGLRRVYIPLTDSPIVARLIELAEEHDKFLKDYDPNPALEEMARISAELKVRNAEIDKLLKIIDNNDQKIYPNDKCPCGSGLKYKKCCGRQ